MSACDAQCTRRGHAQRVSRRAARARASTLQAHHRAPPVAGRGRARAKNGARRRARRAAYLPAGRGQPRTKSFRDQAWWLPPLLAAPLPPPAGRGEILGQEQRQAPCRPLARTSRATRVRVRRPPSPHIASAEGSVGRGFFFVVRTPRTGPPRAAPGGSPVGAACRPACAEMVLAAMKSKGHTNRFKAFCKSETMDQFLHACIDYFLSLIHI